MGREVWDFIGVHRTIISDADNMVNNIVSTIFTSMNTLLAIDYTEYEDIEQLIRVNKAKDDQYAYFWDWFDEAGLTMLQGLANIHLADDEDTLHFINYRKMLLEMDIENQIIESYFTSIAEMLTTITEFSLTHSELAATGAISDQNQLPKEYFEEYIKLDNSHSKKAEYKYSYHTEGLAETKQGLCYV